MMTYSELKRKITLEDFTEAKAGQEDGVSSYETARQLNLSLIDVNNIFSSKDYSTYENTYNEARKITEEIITPQKAGYYRELVAKKYEENDGLKEQRGWLLEQVYFLRKSLSFLEVRKRQLEDGIKDLEKNLNIGILAMEQLNDNDNFQKVSDKGNKKNK